MESFIIQIPDTIQDHIREIAVKSGLPQGEDAVEAISEGWLQKNNLFDTRISELQLETTEVLEADFPRGALLLTYSGSLITIDPVIENRRRVQYTSIGLRLDVPDSAESQDTSIQTKICLGEPARFSHGPIQRSSPIFKIAVYNEELDPENETEKLNTATRIIAEGFTAVNKNTLGE